jgi:pre-mRNA-splicing factor CWC22
VNTEEVMVPQSNIQDMTEQDLINLRRTIYLVIMSSVDFQECCHKLLKLNIREGQQLELCNMLLECCMQERTYLRFYGLAAQRLCQVAEVFQFMLQEVFTTQYETLHRLEVNKLRNAAKFFSHLLHTDSIRWSCLQGVLLTEDETTSASRIFIKILMQDIAENLGVEQFAKKLREDDEIRPYLGGLFPRDSVENARFAINFFTSIGLGALTDELRAFMKDAPKKILEQKYAELLAQAKAAQEESSSSSSSNSSSGDSSDSDDDSDMQSSGSSSSADNSEAVKQKKDCLMKEINQINPERLKRLLANDEDDQVGSAQASRVVQPR